MLTSTDYQRLGRLLNALHQCMDIKIALTDETAKEVYTTSFQTPFCRAIASTPTGRARCFACDQNALNEICQTKREKHYYCHAGLVEIALPVTENGEVVAMILLGQMLDHSSCEAQWERVSSACAWHPDIEQLYQPFLQLKRISAQQIAACTEIVHACISEVRLTGIVSANDQDDFVRLTNYLDTHYDSKITVEGVCNALLIGKTKLYRLCKTRQGKTLITLVNERRIKAAKDLLLTTDQSIRFISETVGIDDYNYFSKLFRKREGMNPGEYRKRMKSNA